MKINVFLVLTAGAVIALSLHTVMWVADILDTESEGEFNHYDIYESENIVFLVIFSVSLVLCVISVLAYQRNGRTSIAAVSASYTTLVLDSGIWLVEELCENTCRLESVIPTTNAIRAALHVITLGLIAFAFYKKRHGD